jgi:hypothetical protein
VAVAVVQIRPVRMRVNEALVSVPMAVPGGRREPVVGVEVVSVVVTVRVHVLDRRVGVRMAVPAREQQRDGEREQRGARRVGPSERLAEPAEGERGAEERRAREAGLRPRRTELLRRRDVQRDARAIAEAAHAERDRDRAGAGCEGLEGEPQREVDAPRGEALPERAARGGDAIDQRGQLVVERPAPARSRDEQRRQPARPAAARGDDEPRGDHTRDAEPARSRERLAEKQRAERRRGGQLEVQQQRHRAREREAKSCQQQHGADDAAGCDRAREAQAISGVQRRPRGAAAFAPERGGHRRCGAEVEEPGELERAEAPEQPLGGRRRGSEEHRGSQRESDAVHRRSDGGFE